MAISFSVTETSKSELYPSATLATHTFSIALENIVINTQENKTINEYTETPSTCTVRYNTNNSGRSAIFDAIVLFHYVNGNLIRMGAWWSQTVYQLSANTNGSMPRKVDKYYGFYGGDFFNSSNPTQKTLPIDVYIGKDSDYSSWMYTYKNDRDVWAPVGWKEGYKTNVKVATYQLVLDVPPTYSNSTLYFDTAYDYPYTGLTTASVDVSNMTAYYGGYITKAELRIGNQTATLTGDATNTLSSGTLSILLNQVGTFTPTVVVTDSRGQTQTVSLDAITIKGYTSPQVVINDIDRANAQKQSDDEGECALVTASITWTSAIADLTAPTVVAKDFDGNTVTTTTTWYTDKACTTLISDWSTVSAMPIYGFISNANDDPFDLQNSYNITITPVDDMSSGTSVTATLGGAFYTMDFLAGGHGIAFGKPSSQPDLFECDLNAQFNNDLVAQDMFVSLDTTATTGTDKEIYNALVALGWTDVIV